MDNFLEKEIIRIRKLVGDNAQVVCIHLTQRHMLACSSVRRLEPFLGELTAL